MSLWYTSADSESKPHLLHVKYTWYSPPQLKNLFSDAEIFNGPNFDTLDFIRPQKNLSTQIFISPPTLR